MKNELKNQLSSQATGANQNSKKDILAILLLNVVVNVLQLDYLGGRVDWCEVEMV